MSNNGLSNMFRVCVISFSVLVGITSAGAVAQQMGDYDAVPRSVETGVAPLVMLALSNDHQLYFKAYSDYSDLDDDLEVEPSEITYNNNEDYGGYFSSLHCYTYANQVFSISSPTSDHYCTGGDEWSGNFLNWATMTRIDLLRSVLYGGYRKIDDVDKTVLERSYLPNDAHSFAKFYKGAPGELNKLTPSSSATGITMCNTTLHNTGGSKSKDNTSPPLMRVIEGNYSLWASSERYQCLVRDTTEGLDNADWGKASASGDFGIAGATFMPESDSPTASDRTGIEIDYEVRVEPCPEAYVADLPDCKGYGETDTVYKPTGILHSAGENAEVLFGLISGSYNNNTQGGYLRKNIANFANEINPDTGIFLPTVKGIVRNINAFRIAGWQENNGGPGLYDNIGYNEEGSAADTSGDYCRWSQLGFGNGHCVDWGNPLGEILAESYRYFAGLGGVVNTHVAAEDEGGKAPAGVSLANWEPLNDVNSPFACANMNVIGLNTSAQTFDGEIGAYVTGISGSGDLDAATDSLLPPAVDPTKPNYYFVGNNGDIAADMRALLNCNPKQVTNLSEVSGACPDAPGLEGTWDAAGLAKIVAGRSNVAYGELNDPKEYKKDYDINDILLGNQRVITHGLQLAPTLPMIKFNVDRSVGNTNNVVIIPACENWGNIVAEGDPDKTKRNTPIKYLGSCALVDFKVLSLGPNSQSGTLYVNWEDTEQGGDFDQDMHGIIKYRIIDEGGVKKLEVTTEVIGQSTEGRLGFGYTLAGVSDARDRTFFHSGVNAYPGPNNIAAINANVGCLTKRGATIYRTYLNGEVDTGVDGCGSNQAASSEKHTLAGSSGGVLDPVLEFAALGASGKFANVTNPKKLKDALESIIGDIGPTPIAGGGQVAASSNGAGSKLFLHTTYYAQKENADGDRINWVSQIGALFIDDKGRLREDTPSQAVGSINGKLDPNDLIIQFLPRLEGEAEPRVEKYSGETKLDGTFTFDQIAYVWHTTNSFASLIDRKIHTVIPSALSVDTAIETDIVTGDLVKFEDVFVGRTQDDINLKLLGYSLPAEDLVDSVEDLVSFVKGANPRDEYRSRTLDGTTYLLGDVLTSPVIQGRPDYTYARELNDLEYPAYQTRYKGDAQIAYVAANDGLIHAFYAAAPSDAAYNANYTGKTVGQELWAYAPFNLLPHLQWLASPRYVHVPYFDGFMRTFDVKAFDDDGPDGIHVGGWGTILVVGTGRGAGAYDIDLGGADTSELTTRPAYIILDITERGAPPKLIAEISHEDLGFTTGEPDVARFKDAAGNSKWYLVFGSGPRGLSAENKRTAQKNYQVAGILDDTPETFKKPSLFAFDLKDKTLTQQNVSIAGDDTLIGAFIGGVNSVDWDRDFNDDALYFGTVAGDQVAPTGKLYRAYLSENSGLTITPEEMMDLGKPAVNRPLTVIDYRNNYWVFTGTGRFYVRSDGQANNNDNLYVGIKEPKTIDPDATSILAGDSFDVDDLFDTTSVTINNSGVVSGAAVTNADGVEVALADIDALRSELAKKDKDANGVETDAWRGWYFKFGPNQRQHTGTGFLGGTLFFSTTVPGNVQQCSAGDTGYIYVMDMRSGVFSPYYKNGTNVNEVKGPAEVKGIGPEINSPADVMNLSDGSVESAPELDFGGESQRHSWREISIPW